MWVSVDWTPGTLLMPVRHHVGDVLVRLDPDQHDQVDLAGHGVDLAHPVEGGDPLGHLGDPGHVGLDEADGGDHGPNLGHGRRRPPPPTARGDYGARTTFTTSGLAWEAMVAALPV